MLLAYDQKNHYSFLYTCVVVLVELTAIEYQMREDLGSIVSKISYNQSLTNNITIHFHPLTYHQYLNVLGLHLPADFPSVEYEAEGKYFSNSIYIICITSLTNASISPSGGNSFRAT